MTASPRCLSSRAEILPSTGRSSPNSRRLLPHDPTVDQLDDPGAVRGIFLGMRYLYDGGPFLVELLKQVHDLLALAGVEISGGFIRQNYLWTGDDRPGNRDQLLLTPDSWVG